MAETTPVANQIVPPDPTKGLNTFSGILGIQQQQLALQQGQAALPGIQARSQQDVQRNRELQAAQALVFNGAKGGQYTNDDGTLNRQKMADDITTVAPVYGQEVSGRLLSQANEIVANQQAHQALTLSRKKEMGDTFASLAADPELDNTKFIDAIETLRQQHKNDPEFSRMLTSMSTHMPGNADTATLRNLAGRWSAAATGEAQAAPSTIDTGGQVQPGATNRFTGAFTPSGGGVQKTLAPPQQPQNVGSIQAAQDDSARYSEISASAPTARTAMTLADQVSQLADQVRTGKLTKDWADRLTVLQQSNPQITARQMLSKYAAQLQTTALKNAPTDTARNQIEQGMPNPESMDPGAIKEASLYMKGLFGMQQARAKTADAYVQKHGGSPTGIRAVDDQFMSNADPLVFAYRSLPAGQERQDFLRKHFPNPQALQDFSRRKTLVEHNADL